VPDLRADVLLVAVAGHLVALPLAKVREVVRAAAITPLPASPPGVDGVVDVRGTVVPVVDARVRLGLAPRPVDASQVFVLVLAGERLVALRVDEARGVRRRQPGAGEPGGVGRAGDELVVVDELDDLLPAGAA
jgi:purine-binding chemotaxis protein CheW